MNGMLIIVWLCAAIAVAVFATMIGSAITFRGGPWTSPGKATEILWALIPIAIMLATATPALRMMGFFNGGSGS